MKTKYNRASIIFLSALLMFVNSCNEDNDPPAQVPTLTTVIINEIATTSAVGGGNVSDDGQAEVTARGVCWSTDANPTVSDSKTTDGTGAGTFTSSLTGLTANTTYHVRAYAANKVGTAYGNEVSFTTAINPTIPVLTTVPASSVGETSALSGGTISNDGGATVTSRGVCWSTSHDPTTDNDKTTDGSGVGDFVSTVGGLTANTTYYLRAYASNDIGTAYGDEISFTTLDNGIPGQVSDIDGNTYGNVTIGTQIWMTENLKTTRYKDGTDIPFVTDSLGWKNGVVGAYTWFDNDTTYKNIYGALYNWYAVETEKLCPNGWHVPTEDEWATMENYLISNGYNYDGSTNGDRATNNKIAKALADVSTWHPSGDLGSPGNTDFQDKRNASGFKARAGGIKDFYGSFGTLTLGVWFPHESIYGGWWTSSEIVEGATTVWWREITAYSSQPLRSHNDKYFGLSVRCVKD